MRRTRLAAVVLVAVIVSAGAVGASPALGEPTMESGLVADAATPGTSDDTAPRIGDYDPSEFADAAEALPQGLVTAVQRDLGATPEQYLADAAAARDGAAVVEHLREQGVQITGSRVDGNTVTIGVASQSEISAVEATGADAVVGEVSAPVELPSFQPAATLLGGTGYMYLTDAAGAGVRCSIGFNGYGAGKAPQFVTAGHCLEGTPRSAFSQAVQSAPGQISSSLGPAIGSPVSGSFRFGGGADSGLVQVTNSAFTPAGAVSTWGGGKGGPSASPLTVRGDTAGIVGAAICKSGSTTGWTCGHILQTDAMVDIGGATVNTVIADACVLSGDSGGSALVGAFALGVTSGTSQSGTCVAGGLSAFFPLRSATSATSVARQYPGWELQVGLSTPATSLPSGSKLYTSLPFTGTVQGANSETRLSVYWDGRTDAAGANATVTVSASGTWSAPLPSVGTHTYRLVARWGTQASAAATGTITVATTPTVSRLSGSDRFETAVQVSKKGYPSGASTVFVASGVAFPDALSAGPAAVAKRAPLLLTTPGAVPSSTLTELRRLHPSRIVLVGGLSAVSQAAASQLAAIAPVTRLSGSDRFETSRKVAAYAYPRASRAFVASGMAFPDALSAGAAASTKQAPVILVPGSNGAVDTATTALLRKLGVSSIDVVGGPASVTAAYASSLGAVATVRRDGGSDRFETAIAVNKAVFSSAPGVFLASGVSFPDALSGSVLAGASASPLYVVPSGCLPRANALEISRLGAGSVSVVGGTAVLGTGVSSLTLCR